MVVLVMDIMNNLFNKRKKEKKRYKIDYDQILRIWIIWEIASDNLMIQVYSNKLKRECEKFYKKLVKENK